MIAIDDLVAAIDAFRSGVLLVSPATRPQMETQEPLTEREFEVLCHLAWGGRTDGIAYALALSPDTIKFHVAALLRKLQARNRSHAVAVAYRRGILQAGDLAGWAVG